MRWCTVDRALWRAGRSGYQLGIAAEAQAVEIGNILEELAENCMEGVEVTCCVGATTRAECGHPYTSRAVKSVLE